MVRRIFLLFVFVFLTFISIGCSTLPSQSLQMVKGSFGVPIPEDFHGVGRELEPHSCLMSATVSFSYAKDREIPMDVQNEEKSYGKGSSWVNGTRVSVDELILPASDVDFTYDLPQYSISGSFDFVYKFDKTLAAFSIGGQYSDTKLGNLFFRSAVGFNLDRFEWGLFGGFMFPIGYEGDVEGYMFTSGYSDMGVTWPSSKSAYSEEAKLGPPIGNVGAYGSVYWGDFSVNASGSYYSPWAGMEDTRALSPSFKFPALVTLYGGVSYWLFKRLKISAGSTFFLGGEETSMVFSSSLSFAL